MSDELIILDLADCTVHVTRSDHGDPMVSWNPSLPHHVDSHPGLTYVRGDSAPPPDFPESDELSDYATWAIGRWAKRADGPTEEELIAQLMKLVPDFGGITLVPGTDAEWEVLGTPPSGPATRLGKGPTRIDALGVAVALEAVDGV